MNLTNVFRVIGRHKVLAILGLLVAAAAAFATAFRVETGTLEPRAEVQYRAATQVLVSDPISVFSSRNASQVVPDGTTAATARDLASLTVVYAYLASSDEILAEVEDEIGPLTAEESLTAAQRTTQPTSETNTGTYRLPILEIMGTSPDAERAELIARTATERFQEFAVAQQDASGVPPESRVQLPTVDEKPAAALDGTNPALPVVAVGVGVLLAFLALIFAVDNARRGRRESEAAAGAEPAAAPAPRAAHAAQPEYGHPVPTPAYAYAAPPSPADRTVPPSRDLMGSTARG